MMTIHLFGLALKTWKGHFLFIEKLSFFSYFVIELVQYVGILFAIGIYCVNPNKMSLWLWWLSDLPWLSLVPIRHVLYPVCCGNAYFVHSSHYETAPNLVRIATKQRQPLPQRCHIIKGWFCKQTQHPFWVQFSHGHVQVINQNRNHCAFWYAYNFHNPAHFSTRIANTISWIFLLFRM